MLAEFLDSILDLNNAARRITPIPCLESRRKTFFDVGNGLFQDVSKELPIRNHKVGDLESFCVAIERYLPDSGECSVWVSLKQAVAVFGDKTDFRCDVVTLPVEPHFAFELLRVDKWRNQSEIVDLLRHDLASCEILPVETIDAVRSLKYGITEESTGKISHSSAVLGKSVTAQISGEFKIPEFVTVAFCPFPSVFDSISLNLSVACTLFTKPEAGALKLTPQPGEMERVERTAIEKLRRVISDELMTFKGRSLADVPVLMGTP